MKKLLLFSLLFLCSQLLLSQQDQTWKWNHQKPQGNTLRWVKMWDNNNWYAVGYGGTFMKTSDAGQTWYYHHKAGVPSTDYYGDLYSAHFRNMDTGFVAGIDGIMTTVDGGQTFQPLAVPLSSSGTVYNVYMINNMVGYVAGTSSIRIAKTTDGGFSWTPNTAITSATYYDVWSPDENLIVASSTSGNIRRSTDGGLTFTTVLTGASATLYKLSFKDANTGYVTGSTSAVRMTTDAGLTWTDIGAGLPASTTFYDIDLVGNDIYLTGHSYNIYKTTDIGVAWTAIGHLAPVGQQPWTAAYYSTYFYNDRFLVVGSYGFINQKIGEGTPTIYTDCRKLGTFYDIWSESATGKVIAVGTQGNSTSADQAMYSTDGGITWKKALFSSISSATFRAVEMITPELGYISGSNSALYRTTNSGVNWDSIPTPAASSVTFYDVDFINSTIGWVFGTTGSIFKTTDAGATWTQQTSAMTGTIYSGSMVDANIGWFSGASGAIYNTTDGGTTWTPQVSGFGTSVVYAVKALSSNIAYIVGASSKISKTTDGGTTWNFGTVPFAASTTIYAIDFTDQNHGAISGASGRVGITTDGGATWLTENTNNDANTLYAIKVAETGTNLRAVFTAGGDACIFKNSNFSVPVELTSFTAKTSGSTVVLNWSTSTETNNRGFAVERKSESDEFVELYFINGKGTTTQAQSYSYSDKVTGGKYTYRLRQVDFDGTVSYSKEVAADVSSPAVYELTQNYPNPFNPATTIRYSVPAVGMVKISVYNMIGEKVADVVNDYVTAGSYEVSFNASQLSSGVYFYKIEAGSFVKTMKMTVLK